MSAHRVTVNVIAVLAATVCRCHTASSQTGDPPARVGRISVASGAVSFLPVGENDWTTASLNYPLTSGDALSTDVGGRAELHIGAATVAIASSTSLSLDAIDDSLVQLRIGQGAIHFRLRELGAYDSFEIDTPAGVVVLRSIGEYRIDVTPDGRRAIVSVRNGDADVYVGDQPYRVQSGSSLTLFGGNVRPVAAQLVAADDWENWARSRDQREDGVAASRYLSRDMVGYEDLDDYGDWQVDPSYGAVWYPRSVAADWAPYRTGHWESVAPWGWTWIDDNRWGFAPFHYGRWSHDRGRWGWIPGAGAVRERPVYAPALVAFISGAGWNASLSFGSRGGVGWVPLAPNEPYVPAYRASDRYVSNLNRPYVRGNAVNVRVDVNTFQYANRNIPGAVTAVPRDAFERSRPVAAAAVQVRPADLGSVRVSTAPIAAGVTIAPPPSGAARPRPSNVAVVQRPPVDLSHTPPVTARGRGRGNEPPAITLPPPAGRGNPPPAATPPPVVQTPPPDRGGRGRGAQQPPPVPTPPPARAGNPPPQVMPPTAPPTQPPPPPTRGRGRRAEPPPVPPPATIPTPPPATPPPPPPQRGGGRGSPPPPPVPPPATPPPPPPQRGGGRGAPPPPTTPPPSQGRGRGGPPDTGHGSKPPRGKPDSGRGGGALLEMFFGRR